MICSSEEEITTKLKCFATRENYFNKIIVLNNIPFKLNMSINRYFLPDFIEIQRNSFRELLDKGLIEEFSKRNPINNVKKDLELYFYPEYYKLTVPEFNPKQAILNSKSYTSKLYMPVQLTDKISKIIKLKWVYIGNLPLMTKRGHFILNGSARVIVNQIIRSPGIYYQQKLYENYTQKWSQKPESSYKRYYADLICLRGTWLRLEIDKNKNIWAQTKKGPKIPAFWFLIAMGLSQNIIFQSVLEPAQLVRNLQKGYLCRNEKSTFKLSDKNGKQIYPYITDPPDSWKLIYSLISGKNPNQDKTLSSLGRKWIFNKFMNPRTYDLGKQGRSALNKKLGLNLAYNQLTLTPQDLLYATDFLIKVEKGLKNIDDIDHLKNRRVRTSGDLIQIQIGNGVLRLEKLIRDKMNESSKKLSLYSGKKKNNTSLFSSAAEFLSPSSLAKLKLKNGNIDDQFKGDLFQQISGRSGRDNVRDENSKNYLEKSETKKNALVATQQRFISGRDRDLAVKQKNLEKITDLSKQNLLKKSNLNKDIVFEKLKISHLINTKAFNSALREFFGTSPLSQFMDQINPLSDITHKRRLSSMGPGGVTRDTATLAIRGIHPTHYGRICPVETPEGKNTGLVNSMTTYARVNLQGILESPFYKVYKGQVQKTAGMFFLSAEAEENIKLAAADLFVSSIKFLPRSYIPVRFGEDFTKITRNEVQYIGVSPIQMISIATSLIPFLEHDDANRALMGSNMQRQAVPLIRPERPVVGTGLEARAVSDSGHVVQSKLSGLVTYVSGEKIVVTTILNL
jgi:DNA-directed RNA polymerase subunit beta